MSFLPQLQLALDLPIADSFAVLEAVHAYIDIIEVGTPLIYREGMSVVRSLRAAYPEHKIVADLKIMDAGALEADIAFDAGADVVTVLALAADKTIEAAVMSAKSKGKSIMVDMIQVPNLVERAEGLGSLGVNHLCVHTAYDLQAVVATPYEALQVLREAFRDNKLAIAGGVNLKNLATILPFKPDTIIVGGAICNAENPAEVAKAMHEKIRKSV